MKQLDAFAIPIGGIQLVEASAGTGKTHAITTLFLRTLLLRRLEVDRILVVTFTKAATAELRDRVRKRLREAVVAFQTGSGSGEIGRLLEQSADRARDLAHLTEALTAFDRASIFTIHGFCQRVLEEHAFEGRQRFDLELATDPRSILRELVEDFWASELDRTSEAELAHLERRGVDLKRWTRLVGLVTATPSLVVEPTPAGLDHEASLREFLEARAALGAIWATAKADVERLLSNAATFKQSSHSADKVPGWLADIDAMLGRAVPTLDGFDPAVRKLTPEALSDATKKGRVTPHHAVFDACGELVAAHDRAAFAFDDWLTRLEQKLVAHARTELRQKKLGLGIQSYDDLLLDLSRALAGADGEKLGRLLADRYPVALVDEFQDTDPVQYGIFRRMYRERGALFLIGDPKQAIYAFRGADIFSYLSAARDAGAARHTLSTNRRSEPSLVRAVNTLFSRPERPFVLDGIEFSPVDPAPGVEDTLTRAGSGLPPLELAFVSFEDGAGRRDQIVKDWAAYPARVASHVASALASKMRIGEQALAPEHIAILTRKNDQAFAIQAELRRLGVPSVMLGDKSVLDADEAFEMALVLRALARPSDEVLVLSALSTSIFGLTGNELHVLRDDESAWERRIDDFRRWRVLWERHGFMRAFRSLLRNSAAGARLLAQPSGERRFTNFLHLAELLHRAACEEHLGIAGLCRWFDDARFDPSKRGELATDLQQLRLESDARAVKLTTMHRSKGLEYEVVFCPHLWDGTHSNPNEQLLSYHDPADADRPKLCLRPLPSASPQLAQVELERRAENMRLAYVAITRAKRRASIFWGPFLTRETSPLAELLHASEPGSRDGTSAGQRVHALGTSRLRGDLDRVAGAAAGAIEVTDVSALPGPVWRPARPGTQTLRARAITRRVSTAWHSSSFSGLTAATERLSLPAAEGRDLDEGTGVGELEARAGPAEERVLLAAFPRGAKSGNAMHDVLEQIDFQRGDAEELGLVTSRALARQGIDPSWAPVLAEALDATLRTPLLDVEPALRLSEVARSQCLSELEFTFPVALRQGLSPGALAQVFAAVPDGLPHGYAERVALLGFAPLRGYLRGFIDLVFEHRGRFWVVDYKSNFLGERPQDYVPARLGEAMSHHHYVLQYHVYCVAVERYLAQRIPGFLRERDFGGVLYLFLRGMSPERGPSTGVYFERPPTERMQLLERLLGGTA